MTGQGRDIAGLERLLRDTESDRSERTRATNDSDKFSTAICAFANDMPQHRQPGYLFIGANPDGSASGARIDDELLTALGDLATNGNIQPLPSIAVFKANLAGGDMAVIEVQPADMPPVRYKGIGWKRVGPRRAQLSEQDERILAERRADTVRTWDARPCRGATEQELILDLFKLSFLPRAVAQEVLAENHRDLKHQLAALRFWDLRSDCPTHAAILVFGQDPLAYVPGAYCQYVAYDGTSLADEVRKERRFSGDLLTVLRGLDELCKDLAGARPVAEEGSSLREKTVYDYPPVTLRELILNAVIHRNYDASSTPIMINHFSDRIEIQNPGGLYFDLAVGHFPHGTAYRNPVLAEAAKVYGFVNRFGRGITRAQAFLVANGSPEAEFMIERNDFLVKVRQRLA